MLSIIYEEIFPPKGMDAFESCCSNVYMMRRVFDKNVQLREETSELMNN